MHFETEGKGPALFLVPGLGCDDRQWRPAAERLREHFTVVFPQTWKNASLHAAAQGLVNVMDELQLTQAHLAGLSMGGYMVFECLRHWPERVRAAALLDTTAYPDGADRIAKREQVLRLLAQDHFEEVLQAFVASVLSPGRARTDPSRARMIEMGRDLGSETFAADTAAILRRGAYVDVLPLLRVPILFVAGEHDTLTPPDVARRMAAEVPGSKVVVIAEAGHMTALEQPERVADVLARFFDKTPGRLPD